MCLDASGVDAQVVVVVVVSIDTVICSTISGHTMIFVANLQHEIQDGIFS